VIGQPVTMLIPEDRLGELNAYQSRLKNGERIAHESRNAMQRILIGVDMLGFEMAEDSDSWKDLQRIPRAKEDLQQIYEELRNYAAPMKLECDVCSVGADHHCVIRTNGMNWGTVP